MLSCAMALGGCVLSVEPVVPVSEATFDPRLLGAWEEESGFDRAVVSRGDENAYVIEYTSGGKTGRFEARLGRLRGRTVLDVWPAPGNQDVPELYTGLLIAGHVLIPLDFAPEEVLLAYLEPDSIRAAIHAGTVHLASREAGSQLVLRGGTSELRSVVGPYLARRGVLSKPDVWRRAPNRGPAPPSRQVETPCFEASAWREADQLFHRDPHWVGADVASSVDLGGGRTLWLFGDTWVDPSGRGTRRGAVMISNSVAIQTGMNPATADISFFWGRAADGSPVAVFPDRGRESLWFGNGVRVGDRLVLFFARTLRNTGTGLGFEHVGWAAVMVENPDDPPSSWRVRQLAIPSSQSSVLVGFASVLLLGDNVYAFGPLNTVNSHPTYAARWPAERIHGGDLENPQWWAGPRLGWVPDSSSAPRRPLLETGQDPTIILDPAGQRFLEVQTQGFGPADVAISAAPALAGPWSPLRIVYRPPEYYRPNVMVYSAKVHPQLTGADLVLTYATNTFQFAEHLTDSLIYYPRFVRLARCRRG